jgi:DNA-binding IclR family transcriptional regulator
LLVQITACPVFDAYKAVCGSVSVGVPKPRYSAELGKKIAEHLKDACRRLSETLEAVGYIHQWKTSEVIHPSTN